VGAGSALPGSAKRDERSVMLGSALLRFSWTLMPMEAGSHWRLASSVVMVIESLDLIPQDAKSKGEIVTCSSTARGPLSSQFINSSKGNVVSGS